MIVPEWRTADNDATIATGLQAMEAVGVKTVLIAECHGFDSCVRQALRWPKASQVSS